MDDMNSYTSLESINFYRITSHKGFPAINTLPTLQSITIAESPLLNLNKFLKKISDKDELLELNFIDNELNILPASLTKFNNLISFSCVGNNDLELSDNSKILNELSKLKSLIWIDNDAAVLPANLSFYNRLEYLDISENGIVELPKIAPSPLRNLTYLDISNNIIVDHQTSIENLGMRLIKEIWLDGEDLSPSEISNIQSIHSKAIFNFIGVDTTKPPDIKIAAKDSFPDGGEIGEKENSEKQFYGKIGISELRFKAHSTAYIHYPEIFNHAKFKYTFDSTSFEERYLDISYENVRKILPNRMYENLALTITHKPIKGELWFEFAVSTHHWLLGYSSNPSMRRYINRYNKELNAFRNMVFVLQGEIERKEFKKAYVKKKYFTDFRLYYNEGESNFILELKDLEAFKELYVYPRYKSKSMTLEKAQETYTKRYIRYSKYLERRKVKFHRDMKKNKAAYDKQYNKVIATAWRDFTDLYMSDEEKAMSREEWLVYYDQIVANEKRALDASDISMSNLKRSLQMSGYVEVSFADLTFRYVNSTSHEVIFTDENNDRLAVVKYAIIDRLNKLIVPLEGGTGQGSNLMIKGLNHNEFEIILELRNGDMAVVKQDSFKMFESSKKDLEEIKAEIYDQKLSHIGLFWDRIDF